MAHLYLVCRKTDDGVWLGPCKVGISAKPEKRLASLQTGSPYPLAFYEMWGGDDLGSAEVRFLEGMVHHTRASKRLRGEWFDVTPEEMRQLTELALNALKLAGTGNSDLFHYGQLRNQLGELVA